MVTTLRVSGMTCNNCVKHVETALRGVAGVTAAEVDLAAGVAKVVHDGVAEPALVEAVVEAGYDVTI